MQKFCPNNELCKYQIGSQCRDKCVSESAALSACYPDVPRKNWSHSNEYICCVSHSEQSETFSCYAFGGQRL